MNRDEFIKTALVGILSRKTPPAAIKGSQEGQRAEVAAMVKTIARYAPTTGIDLWWDRFEDNLSRRMKTHGWPIPSEIDASCREVSGQRAPGSEEAFEQNSLRIMSEWRAKFGSQMPRMGRPDRTAELIRRGILKNERDAKYRGYDLDERQMSAAAGQEPTRDETSHHNRILGSLRSINEAFE
jgi:hypothetical protein